jgi:hypothetical protein
MRMHTRTPSKCVTINRIHETMIHCIRYGVAEYIKNRERVIFVKNFLGISVVNREICNRNILEIEG